MFRVWNRTVAAEAQDDEGLGLSTFRARNGEAADDETVRLALHEMRQVREDAARKFGNRPASDFKPTERIATVFVEGRAALGKRGTPEPVAEIVYRYLGDGRVAALARLAPQLPQPPAFGAALTPEQREELRRKREETRRIMRSRDRNKNWNWPRVFEPVGRLSYRARNGVSVDEAERLEREGYFPEEIFRRTGWYRDEDQGDEWRYDAGRAAEDGGASTARARNREIAASIGLEIGADLSTQEEADKFIRFMSEIPAEEPPKQLPVGTPKAAFAWFEGHMAGRTFTVNGKPFHVNPGHFFRFTCEEPADKSVRKGHVAKAASAEDAMEKIRNGEISSSDVAGYIEARGRSLPFIERILENWDAIVGGGRKFRLVKKFQTNRREVDIVVFQHNPDGATVGPITSHMRVITRGFLNGNNLLAIGDGEAALNRTENPASERASAENNAGTLSQPTQ